MYNRIGRLHLSDRAHIVFDFHQAIDGLNEAKLGDNPLYLPFLCSCTHFLQLRRVYKCFVNTY
jgi:hypothetical protein